MAIERKTSIRGECRTASEPQNCAIERQSHVEEEMQLLADTIGNLEIAQQTLFNRIGPIVADEGCSKEGEDCPESYRVMLASQIRNLRYRVENIVNATQSVTRRIEL